MPELSWLAVLRLRFVALAAGACCSGLESLSLGAPDMPPAGPQSSEPVILRLLAFWADCCSVDVDSFAVHTGANVCAAAGAVASAAADN